MTPGTSGRLQDKVVIVTGSSSGLGRAISLLFASEGASLIVCADITPKPSGATEDEKTPTHEDISNQHGEGKARFVSCDVGDSADVENAVKLAVEWGGRLDVYVRVVDQYFV